MRSPRSRELGAGGRGGGLDEDVPDWQSTVSTASSTVATTASLTSRIAALAIDLEDAARKDRECEELGTFPEEEEEEEVVEVTEEEMMKALDSQEDPFQVCSRLFHQKNSNAISLRKLNITHVEEFKQHGYLVLDNFISKDAALTIRDEALRLERRGRLMEASKIGNAKFQDTKARGDHVLWLKMGQPPMDRPAFAPLALAFQELGEDFQEFMKLANQSTEFQLAVYPGGNSHYVKHRDAFPDDGSEGNQRRVTAVVYMNSEWKSEDGGILRIWPPRKIDPVNHAAHLEHRHRFTDTGADILQASSSNNAHHLHYPTLATFHRPPGISAASYRILEAHMHYYDRRMHESPRPAIFASHFGDAGAMHNGSAVSELDISVSDPSECGSLRSDVIDPALCIPKSTTSSVMAEIGMHDGQYDASSVDDLSVVSHENAKTGIEWVEVQGEMVLEVAPLAGRLVIFLSGAVDHAVQPCNAERVAVSAWFQ